MSKPLDSSSRLHRTDYFVAPAALDDAQQMVRDYHYSQGGSNTAVYVHGLFRRVDSALVGVAWWLPPTRVTCESVNRASWQRVLSLTRLVILPDYPANACSFLLARSIRLIWKDDRFWSLVTYADEARGHLGAIYRAANWHYVGRTGPYPRWEDSTGRQVAPKATKNRRKAEMETLGLKMVGRFYKHKFVLHSPKREWPEEFKRWIASKKTEQPEHR
jgi:hypothetical protein